jgi:DNA-binding transcriptional MerR regulator
LDLEKKYYSISEVADMIQSNASLLRFWEKEFPNYIKPQKNKKGNRIYQERDIKYIKIIHHLVKDRGYTLQGAKTKLNTNSKDTIENVELVMELERIKKTLEDIRDQFSY